MGGGKWCERSGSGLGCVVDGRESKGVGVVSGGRDNTRHGCGIVGCGWW